MTITEVNNRKRKHDINRFSNTKINSFDKEYVMFLWLGSID